MKTIVRIVCVSFALLSANTLLGQDANSWKQLSHQAFTQQAAGELRAKTTARGDVEAEAQRRLVETDAASAAPYAVVDQLTGWAARRLSDAEKSAVVEKLQSRGDKGTTLPFVDFQRRYNALSRLSASLDDADGELLAWIDAHDFASLEVPQLEWLCFKLGQSNIRGDRVQIEWNGFLRPEKQGQYTFSPSRICTDRDWGSGRIRSFMQVMLDGAEIINTAENGWHTESQPLLLDNTRDIPIQVSFTHDREKTQIGQSCPAIAMLYWSGPGVDFQLVPSAALKPADGQGQGLTGHYKLLEVNRETRATKLLAEATRVDPQIDAAWWQSHNTGFRPRRPQMDMLLDHLIIRYGDASYLAELRKQINARGKQNIDQWRQASELMTSAQRQKFLQALLDNPQFIESLRLSHVRRLHQFMYPGNDEKAIDLFRPWLHAQSDIVEPPFRAEPRSINSELQTLVDDIAMLPSGITYFRENNIARPDGSCCLLAAYIAAYGSTLEIDRSAFANWVDEHLADFQLGGDRRVGWLIARAIAEGLRINRPRHLYINKTNGWPWLEEALDAAETEPMKLLVARHQAVRLLDAGEKYRLRHAMQDFERTFASETAKAKLAKWSEALGKLGVGQAPPRALTADELSRYLNVLKGRAASAESRGDTDALARYRALIAKLETD